jgi:hypothetical protein
MHASDFEPMSCREAVDPKLACSTARKLGITLWAVRYQKVELIEMASTAATIFMLIPNSFYAMNAHVMITKEIVSIAISCRDGSS